MKAVINESGDLVLEDSYRSGAWFGVIYIGIFSAIGIYLQGIQNIPIYVILIFVFIIAMLLILVRMNLHSDCQFRVVDKKFIFDVVAVELVKSGEVSINEIEKIIEQESNDDGLIRKRFAAVLGKKTIPLYLAFRSDSEHNEMRNMINTWLDHHSLDRLIILEGA